MRAVLAVLATAFAACSGSSPPPVKEPPPAPAPTAQDYERGNGVARDYTRAAEVYEDACASGAGDLAACRRLLDAIGAARGVPFDSCRMVALAKDVCDRGALDACLLAALVSNDATALAALVEPIEIACTGGDPDACRAAILLHGGDGGEAVSAREHMRRVACDGGWIENCAEIVKYGADPDPEIVERTREACDAGDAIACEAFEGRAIDPDVLCAAHDFLQCEEPPVRDACAAPRHP